MFIFQLQEFTLSSILLLWREREVKKSSIDFLHELNKTNLINYIFAHLSLFNVNDEHCFHFPQPPTGERESSAFQTIGFLNN